MASELILAQSSPAAVVSTVAREEQTQMSSASEPHTIAARSSGLDEGGAPADDGTALSWRPPPQKLGERRDRDFTRFAELQVALKRSCGLLRLFVKRDFAALGAAAPELAGLCRIIAEAKVAESITKFAPRADALARRIENREKLRIVFIGPVKAGKSTLLNVLMTAHLGTCEMLLPVDNLAATNCIWKVESCCGTVASVFLDGQVLKTWEVTVADAAALSETRDEIAAYLEDHLDRQSNPENRNEVLVQLPLCLLDPFGCHYSLVDTPGFTESDEYEAMVTKFLQDHSHIACMICPLTEGLALPKATKSMLQRSYSKTFWVLSRYDALLLQRPRRGQTHRQTADKVVERFREEIRAMDPRAEIFIQAAQVLMPEEAPEGWSTIAQRDIPEEEARSWLQSVKTHVKDCFLAIQQEQHVLSSQSCQCVDFASDVLHEYTALKDCTQGTLVATEYYAKELQAGAEDAASHLEREVRQEVEVLKGQELDELGATAQRELSASRDTWLPPSQQEHYEALVNRLVPAVGERLQRRLHGVLLRAHERVLDVARRLLREAGIGLDNEASASIGHQDLYRPSSEHLGARYPVESVATLGLVAGAAGCATCTETGAVILGTLGLRIGAASVAGIVGVAVVTVATIGFTVKKMFEVHPFWTYNQVRQDVVERIRHANHWAVLAEASAGRARANLLSGVSNFRYAFSELLLTRGTPRDVLVSIFPDLPLFEAVHGGLERACTDIREFVSAPDLALNAEADADRCAAAARAGAWPRVIDITSAYITPNARTDAVNAAALATLLHLRCQSFVEAEMFGEARHAASVFQATFPDLVLPQLYGVAAHVRFGHLAGDLDHDGALERIRCCSKMLRDDHDHGCGEVPVRIEVWFYAVVLSFGCGARAELYSELLPLLVAAVRRDVALRMAGMPSLKEVVECCTGHLRARMAAIGKELSEDFLSTLQDMLPSAAGGSGGTGGAQASASTGMQPNLGAQPSSLESSLASEEARNLESVACEIRETYDKQCRAFMARVARGVHELLACLPSSQVDIHAVGIPVVEAILAEVDCQLARSPPASDSLKAEIRSRLGAVDGDLLQAVSDEWVRLLGEIVTFQAVGLRLLGSSLRALSTKSLFEGSEAAPAAAVDTAPACDMPTATLTE